MSLEDPLLAAAQRLFGYESLRPGQRQAIQSVLDGRDTLAVLATGGGKSAIYELAGPLLGAPALVISPLIAWQRDQLSGLTGHGHLGAVALNSMETARQRHEMRPTATMRTCRLRPRGTWVRHHVFGDGDVIGYTGSWILLAFDRAGYKRLDVGLVTDGDLLEAAN